MVILPVNLGVSLFQCALKSLNPLSNCFEAVFDVCLASFKLFLLLICMEILELFITISFLSQVLTINLIHFSLLFHLLFESPRIVVLLLNDSHSSFLWSELNILSGLWIQLTQEIKLFFTNTHEDCVSVSITYVRWLWWLCNCYELTISFDLKHDLIISKESIFW